MWSALDRVTFASLVSLASGCAHRSPPSGIPPAAPSDSASLSDDDEEEEEGPKDDAGARDITAFAKANYERTEVRIPMRDGTQLFTTIYRPRHRATAAPILLNRTPYGVGPYGATEFRKNLGPSEETVRKGYIFVYQDVRGRWMSEGDFVDVRPAAQKGGSDDTTDTFDTIAWLVANVEGNNGKVGMWGVSYPGYYAAVGMIDHHPALVAVSPQAPIADWYFDDFRHHGAFFLPHAFNFYTQFGRRRTGPTSEQAPAFSHGTRDGYAFFEGLESVASTEAKYFGEHTEFWHELIEHSDYDAFWAERSVLPRLRAVAPAVLVVGGLFDAEDLYGPLAIYRTIEQRETNVDNRLVMGPWRHGGWARDDGRSLGCIDFGSATSEHYRARIEARFFAHHLDGGPVPEIAEATVFDTGAMAWRDHAVWPPATTARSLWLGDDGALLDAVPAAAGEDQWRSDPARPVPYTQAVTIGMLPEYMVEDQRFASRRADVLTYQTPPLTEPLTVAGPVRASVWLSSTAADADVVVKLIDVWPDGTTKPMPSKPPAYACPKDGDAVDLGGFQQMVRSEVFRARYRDGYEKGKPLAKGPNEIVVPLQDVLHTFGVGHRVMVQIQSSWFPLVDRNPQRWFANPLKATRKQLTAATHRVHRSKKHPSRIEIGVVVGAG